MRHITKVAVAFLTITLEASATGHVLSLFDTVTISARLGNGLACSLPPSLYLRAFITRGLNMGDLVVCPFGGLAGLIPL
jgi:hypothetical protein